QTNGRTSPPKKNIAASSPQCASTCRAPLTTDNRLLTTDNSLHHRPQPIPRLHHPPFRHRAARLEIPLAELNFLHRSAPRLHLRNRGQHLLIVSADLRD